MRSWAHLQCHMALLRARHEFRAWPDHELLPPLLKNMCDPTGHATECQETAGRIPCRAKGLADRHQRVIHAEGSLLERHDRYGSPIVRSRSGCKPLGDLDQCFGAPITIAAEGMIESTRDRAPSAR